MSMHLGSCDCKFATKFYRSCVDYKIDLIAGANCQKYCYSALVTCSICELHYFHLTDEDVKKACCKSWCTNYGL